MIPLHEDFAIVQNRRTAFAVTVLGLHVAEIDVPDRFAGFRIEGIEPMRSEECVDALAVGDRRGRGQRSGVVAALLGNGFVHAALPENFSVAAIDGERNEAPFAGDEIVVVSAGCRVGARRKWLADGDRAGQKNAVAMNDGAGVAEAGKGSFSAQVFLLAPFDGRRGVGGGTGAERTAPMRPVCGLVSAVRPAPHREQTCDNKAGD